MNDAGNHGGSAPGETSPALVFMSPKIQTISRGLDCPLAVTEDYRYYTEVEQSDLVPTLANLLGFPVPLNNLGVVIPDLLGFWERGLSSPFFKRYRTSAHTNNLGQMIRSS